MDSKNEVKFIESIPFRFAIFEGSKPNATAVFPLHLVDWHLLQFSVKVLHNQLLRWMPPNAMPFFDFCLPNPRVLFRSFFLKIHRMRKRIRAIAHKKGSKIRKKLPFQ